MKKIKIVPALLSVAILTGCSLKLSVKEPIFVKQGKEISQEEFKTQIIEALEGNEFYKTDRDLSSKILKYRAAGYNKQKRVRGKKVYYSKEVVTTSDSILQYDSVNGVIKSELSDKSQTEVQSDTENTNKNSAIKSASFVHEGSGDLANKVVTYCPDTLTYSILNEIGEGETAKKYLDNYVSAYYLEAFNSSRFMHFSEATDVENHRFYRNNDVFTVKFKEKTQNTQKGTVDGEEKDVMRYEISTEIKSQADMTKGSETVKVAEKQTLVYTILADYNGYKKGEIVEMETVNYIDFSAVGKDITLSKITDLDKYLAN